MKSIDDALELRGRIFGAFELAELERDPGPRERLTDVRRRRRGARPASRWPARSPSWPPAPQGDFRHIDPRGRGSSCSTRADRCCPFGDQLSRHAQAAAEDRRRGPARREGRRHRRHRHRGQGPATASRRRIESMTKIWAAGVAASPLARTWPSSRRRVDRAGRVQVNPDCTLPGHPEIFVVGDMMALTTCPASRRSPSRAASTRRSRSSRAWPAGADDKPFHYFDKGCMATISRFSRGRSDRQAAASPGSSPGWCGSPSTCSTWSASRTGSPRCCTGSSASSAAAARSGWSPRSRSSPGRRCSGWSSSRRSTGTRHSRPRPPRLPVRPPLPTAQLRDRRRPRRRVPARLLRRRLADRLLLFGCITPPRLGHGARNRAVAE